MTKSQLEAELKAAHKEIAKLKSERLIDTLANALTAAGIPFTRDGWGEVNLDNQTSDTCEWLDIQLFSKAKRYRYTVHFYFTKDKTRLSEVDLFKCKRVYDDANEVKLSA